MLIKVPFKIRCTPPAWLILCTKTKKDVCVRVCYEAANVCAEVRQSSPWWVEPYSRVLKLHQAKQNGVKHFKSLHVQRNMQMDCSAWSHVDAF